MGDDPSNHGRVTGNYHDNHIKRCGKGFKKTESEPTFLLKVILRTHTKILKETTRKPSFIPIHKNALSLFLLALYFGGPNSYPTFVK
jgi:hypothetical protein